MPLPQNPEQDSGNDAARMIQLKLDTIPIVALFYIIRQTLEKLKRTTDMDPDQIDTQILNSQIEVFSSKEGE